MESLPYTTWSTKRGCSTGAVKLTQPSFLKEKPQITESASAQAAPVLIGHVGQLDPHRARKDAFPMPAGEQPRMIEPGTWHIVTLGTPDILVSRVTTSGPGLRIAPGPY